MSTNKQPTQAERALELVSRSAREVLPRFAGTNAHCYLEATLDEEEKKATAVGITAHSIVVATIRLEDLRLGDETVGVRLQRLRPNWIDLEVKRVGPHTAVTEVRVNFEHRTIHLHPTEESAEKLLCVLREAQLHW